MQIHSQAKRPSSNSHEKSSAIKIVIVLRIFTANKIEFPCQCEIWSHSVLTGYYKINIESTRKFVIFLLFFVSISILNISFQKLNNFNKLSLHWFSIKNANGFSLGFSFKIITCLIVDFIFWILCTLKKFETFLQ